MNNSSKVALSTLVLIGVLAVGYFVGHNSGHARSAVGNANSGGVEALDEAAQAGAAGLVDAAGTNAEDASQSIVASRSPGAAVLNSASGGSYLPLEAGLLTGGYLNPAASELLGSKRFDAFFDRFAAQNFGTTDELTAQYRAKFEKDFRSIDAANSLGDLSCATDVCIATVRTGKDDANFDSWYGSVQSTSALPIMAMTQAAIALPGGDVEHRLMFTTSKGSGGFALGTNPR